MLIHLVDFANYTPNLPDADLDFLKSIGVFGAIPGTQIGRNGNFTAFQVQRCRDYGLDVRWDYAWLNWDDWLPVMKFTEGFGLPAWLDIEQATGGGCSHQGAVNIIHMAAQELDATVGCVGYYTSKTKWDEITGGHSCDYCASKLLWDAWYPMARGKYPPPAVRLEMEADINYGFKPYGPWQGRDLWQFASEGPAGSLNADHNFARGELFVVANTEPTQEQLRIAAIEAMIHQYKFKIVGDRQEDGHIPTQLLHLDDSPEEGAVIALYGL